MLWYGVCRAGGVPGRKGRHTEGTDPGIAQGWRIQLSSPAPRKQRRQALAPVQAGAGTRLAIITQHINGTHKNIYMYFNK